jgi:hypothetical protein
MAFDPKNYASADALKKSIDMTKEALADKVDKVEGKQLSTEDYTSAEKSKLAGIAEGANYYTLPIADANTLGGVKIGTGITVAADGTISASGGGGSLSPATTSVLGGVLASDAITVANNGMMDIGQSIAGDGLEVVAGSVVPSGYTPVEYLHGTGQCIRNLYTTNGSTFVRIETEFACDTPPSGEWDIIGGGGDPAWANIPILILQTAATINNSDGHNTDVTLTDYQIGTWLYNTYAISGVTPSINTFHKVIAEWNNGTMTITVDGVSHTYGCQYLRSTTLTLFSNGPGAATVGNIKMKYLKIYQSDSPARDLIPAKNSSNIYGMYDTVSKTFYTKTDGAGDFSGGDPITITTTSYMNITPATTDDIGGVVIGSGLSVDSNGVLSVDVDNALDTTSTNPVQNKVVAQIIGDINSVLEEVL